MASYLTAEQVCELNEKHGWFAFGDAQSDVSKAFAQDAIEKYEAMRAAAPAMMAAIEAMMTAIDNLGGEHATGLRQLNEAGALGYVALQMAKGIKK